MTNEELRRSLTRIADARAARRAELTTPAAAPAPAAAAAPATFAVGDRVFDWRSGSEGEVRSVGVIQPSGTHAITVDLDTGTTIFRAARDLVARPTRPAGRA